MKATTMSSIRDRFTPVLLTAAFLVATCSDPTTAADPDLQDPVTAARKALTTIKNQDIDAFLAILANPNSPAPRSEVARALSDKSPLVKLVKTWDGELGEVRIARELVMPFHSFRYTDSKGTTGFGDDDALRYKGVRVKQEESGWGYHDFRIISEPDLLGYEYSELPKESEDHIRFSEFGVKILNQYRARNADNLIKLSVDAGPSTISSLKPDELESRKDEKLFSDFELSGIEQWDGKIDRVFLTEMAMVEFKKEDEEVFVVVLRRVAGDWRFEDIKSPNLTDFQAAGIRINNDAR